MRDPRSILITGASSGIGEALAMGYAGPGRTLALTGRDAGRLAKVADACRARGAAVLAEAVAAEEEAAMAAFLRQAEARAPLDLVIANAGVSRTLKDLGELDALTRETFAVNVTGVFNTLHPAIELMLPRRRGQLAIVSSIAGFRGLPGAIAYSASKNAVRAYGEALRGRLARQGIGVSVICPGYVRSRMTARNRFPMPFIMDAPNAASIIMRGLARNRGRIAFPWPMYALIRLVTMLPDRLVDRLMTRLPEK
ncbi:MAG: SDR family NAD(P)-dependent oxidoreductase [Alphaproteobacteria bacterium]|nr:SDR family NAD(P)-dependent oxidoreductase [Alphaproteobacteria bacterium]